MICNVKIPINKAIKCIYITVHYMGIKNLSNVKP